DGTGLTPLINTTAKGADSSEPQWSRNGSKVVFTTHGEYGTANTWRVNVTSTVRPPLTNPTAEGSGKTEPQWSPDGSTHVFVSPRKLDGTDAPGVNGTYNIWRVNADGTGLTPLTNTTAEGADSLSPRWSPDGSKVVFTSLRKLDGTDAPNSHRTSDVWRVN